MDLQFGEQVRQAAVDLAQAGKDANQIAKVLCDQDDQGHNYGIGIVLDGNGQPMASSSTLLEYAEKELSLSQAGTYMTTGQHVEDLKRAVLRWQRIPESYWDQFQLVLPSDAGTGAVMSAIDLALQLDPEIDTLGVQEMGWPAYRAMARVSRIDFKTFPADGVIAGDRIFPVYQAGPMNTIGLVLGADVVEERPTQAAQAGTPLLLDRAYPGFEFARLVDTHAYDDIMRMSYELQLKPFIDQSVPFLLAISPTKAFITFALRPCGLLLVFSPDNTEQKDLTAALNTTIRARGSAFEHPTSRAFAKALTHDLPRLEQEHLAALKRLATAEHMWRKLVAGTPIEYLYSDNYAGLFRNPQAREGAEVNIYGSHIYPVFANDRCRQNITGLPTNEGIAKDHVAAFAAYCD